MGPSRFAGLRDSECRQVWHFTTWTQPATPTTSD